MHVRRRISLLLSLAWAVTASAGEFDGSKPLECTAAKGHDCLPTSTQCDPLKPESSVAPVFTIDFAKGEVHSPFRTALLRVKHRTINADSLVLQGADLQFAWSALVDKKSGALTVTIADRKGAYVVFGQCKSVKQP